MKDNALIPTISGDRDCDLLKICIYYIVFSKEENGTSAIYGSTRIIVL